MSSSVVVLSGFAAYRACFPARTLPALPFISEKQKRAAPGYMPGVARYYLISCLEIFQDLDVAQFYEGAGRDAERGRCLPQAQGKHDFVQPGGKVRRCGDQRGVVVREYRDVVHDCGHFTRNRFEWSHALQKDFAHVLMVVHEHARPSGSGPVNFDVDLLVAGDDLIGWAGGFCEKRGNIRSFREKISASSQAKRRAADDLNI